MSREKVRNPGKKSGERIKKRKDRAEEESEKPQKYCEIFGKKLQKSYENLEVTSEVLNKRHETN